MGSISLIFLKFALIIELAYNIYKKFTKYTLSEYLKYDLFILTD